MRIFDIMTTKCAALLLPNLATDHTHYGAYKRSRHLALLQGAVDGAPGRASEVQDGRQLDEPAPHQHLRVRKVHFVLFAAWTKVQGVAAQLLQVL